MSPLADATSDLADSRAATVLAQPVQRPQTAGALALLTSLYIVVVVGRIGDIVPVLSALPLAKIVAAAAVFVALRNREKLAPTAVWSVAPARFTILFMLLATVSMLYSILHSGTLGVITGTVLSVSIGLVLMIKAARNWAATRVLLFGCVVSAIVLAIAAGLTSYAGRAGDTRSLDPNDFAFVLDGLLPIVITFALVSRGAKKLCYVGITILVTITILLTESRGGFLGLLVDILALMLLVPAKRSWHSALRPSRGTIAARVLLVVIAGTLAWHVLPERARTRLATITSLSSDYNVKTTGTGRFAIWAQTLPLALRRPWGYGAGTFDTADGLFGGGRYKAPHNMFLQALIEIGVLGLALLVATIVSSLRHLAREWRSVTGGESPSQEAVEKRAFAGGVAASLLGLCVSGFFLSELYSETVWTVVALACLLGRPPQAPAGLPDDLNTHA